MSEDERCAGCGRLDPDSCPCPPDSEEPDLMTYDIAVQLATDETEEVLTNIAAERVRQVTKWGVQARPNGTGAEVYRQAALLAQEHTDAGMADGSVSWLDILLEEVFEAAAEDTIETLRAELVQVAAVAVSWIEDLDRETFGKRPPIR